MSVMLHGLQDFRRAKNGRWIAGVCAGTARSFGWNVKWVRMLWLLVAMIPVLPGLPLYLLLWIFTRAE